MSDIDIGSHFYFHITRGTKLFDTRLFMMLFGIVVEPRGLWQNHS